MLAQREQRTLDVVDGLRDVRVGQPGRQRLVVVRAETFRVEVGGRCRRRAANAEPGQRADAAPPLPAERDADAVAVAGVLGQPLLDVVDVQPGERDVEALLGLGLGRCRPSRTAARAARGTAGRRRARCTSSRSHCWRARSSGPRSSVTSRTSSVSRRFSSTPAEVLAQRVADLALDRVDLLDERRPGEPYSRTHLAAVFSPTPGMFGRLSLGSPRSAAKSGYCAGVEAVLLLAPPPA